MSDQVLNESQKTVFPQWMKKFGDYSKNGFKVFRGLVTIGVAGYFSYNFIVLNLKKRLLLSVHDETILRWKYDDIQISETKSKSETLLDFANYQDPTHLSYKDLLEVLALAEIDPRIQGLIIDFGKTSAVKEERSPLGLAQLQEIRERIQQLQRIKKEQFGNKAKFIAYTDDFSDQRKYYLASVFDQIQVGPLAQIPFYGIGARSLFFKGLLDKVGINFNASTRDKHKGVYSSLTCSEFPIPIKENMSQLFNSLNSQMLKDIAASRGSKINVTGITSLGFINNNENSLLDQNVAAIKYLQDIAPLSPLNSFISGLVDTIQLTTDKFINSLVSFEKIVDNSTSVVDLSEKIDNFQRSGAKQVKDIHMYFMAEKLRRKKSSRFTPLFKLDSHEVALDGNHSPVAKSNLKIGVVYLCGAMMRGNATFGSTNISEAILNAGSDNSIDAILFRIDSGGGDARAAENIWQTIKHVQEEYKKPIIASFGNVCASGGYYVAAPCDAILASPGTITGSIGVASARPLILPKLLDAAGITVDEISFSEGFRNTSSFRDLDENAKKRYEQNLDETYDLFLSKVVSGRQIEYHHLKNNIAGGRVWSGEDALELGLLDKLGGFEDALKVAVAFGRVNKIFLSDRIEIKEFPRKKSLFEKIQSMDSTIQLGLAQSAFNIVKLAIKEQFSSDVKKDVYDNINWE